MAKINYSIAALEDLIGIGDYIAEELKSPPSALNTVNMIQDTIDNLIDFPLMGVPLSSVVNMDTDYKFLVCGNYLAFYRTNDDIVFIDRILYGRRDYINILFNDLQQNDTI